MTNEELTVLAGLATELRENRMTIDDLLSSRAKTMTDNSELIATNKRLTDECNRLREGAANALNAEREAVCDRDDAREKLGKWARFIKFTVYTALNTAKDRKDCRKILKDTLEAMRKFNANHPITIIEGGAQ